MPKMRFDLYIDESGSFSNDHIIDPARPMETSLVGGLLIDPKKLTDSTIGQMLPEHVHCCEKYKKSYLDVMQQALDLGGRFVIFENRERLKVINGDTTYLNIISEGLVKLMRDLSNDHPDGVDVRIYIAVRKQMSAASGIIKQSEYLVRLEEKLLLALGRNHVAGCTYQIIFEDARTFKRLDFADIICNTWLTRKREKKFNEAERARIEKLYDGQMIYPVFEDAMTTYLKQLLLERHYGEMMYQICTLPKLQGFTDLRNKLIRVIAASDRYEQETWFAQMSLQISRYNRLKMYVDGIRLAENYQKYFLECFAETEGTKRTVPYWRFDTDFYLLTMYDHVGNLAKCQYHMQACRANISCVNRSWEHIDYYFSFCIRELNVLMGRYAFDEVIRKSEELVRIFEEARDLFSLIKTYNGTEQPVRSELLGKVYGVQLEAYCNLLHNKPDLFDQALAISDKALAEFDDPRDISRQYQWRCLLMVEAGKVDEALDCLLKAAGIEEKTEPFKAFVQQAYMMKSGMYDFLLWHYTNVMLLMKQENDPRGDEMAKALIPQTVFMQDIANENRSGHPWNLVLWNAARYERSCGRYAGYIGMYRQAMKLTCENPENVTMMTFALSMAADRLLWCRENQTKDLPAAQKEFEQVCKELEKAGMTEEMMVVFGARMEKWPLNSQLLLSQICNEYLK